MPNTQNQETSVEKLSVADEIIEVSQMKSPEAAYKYVSQREESDAIETSQKITTGEVKAEPDGIILIEKDSTRLERQQVTADTLETLGQIFVLGNELKGSRKADYFATVVPERCFDKLFGTPSTIELAKAGGKQALIAKRFGFDAASKPGGDISLSKIEGDALADNLEYGWEVDSYSEMVRAIHARSSEDFDKVSTYRYRDVAEVCKNVALFALEDIQEIARSGSEVSIEDMSRLQQMMELVNKLTQQGLVHERMAYVVDETLKDKDHLFVPRDPTEDSTHPFFLKNNPNWKG